MLLVRLDHSIDLLNTNDSENFEHVQTIIRPQPIETAVWCTSKDENNFLFVERNTVFKLKLNGDVIVKHHFENLLLRDVAVVPKTELLLVLGRVLFSRKPMLPYNSRAEKQLLLYDMATEEHKSCNPFLDDMRHITLADYTSSSREGLDVLICHKNRSPPRLWTLVPHLNIPHELKPGNIHLQSSPELTGPGYFVGDRHQMISCVGADGDIHIWNCESGDLEHHILAQDINGSDRLQAQCVAWSSTSEPSSMKFATVGIKKIRIWSAVESDRGIPTGQTPGPSSISPDPHQLSVTGLNISTLSEHNSESKEKIPIPDNLDGGVAMEERVTEL